MSISPARLIMLLIHVNDEHRLLNILLRRLNDILSANDDEQKFVFSWINEIQVYQFSDKRDKQTKQI